MSLVTSSPTKLRRMKFVATLALTLTLSPEEKEQPAHVSFSRLTVRPTQLRIFQKRGERESPLLGERVWVREVVNFFLLPLPVCPFNSCHVARICLETVRAGDPAEH